MNHNPDAWGCTVLQDGNRTILGDPNGRPYVTDAEKSNSNALKQKNYEKWKRDHPGQLPRCDDEINTPDGAPCMRQMPENSARTIARNTVQGDMQYGTSYALEKYIGPQAADAVSKTLSNVVYSRIISALGLGYKAGAMVEDVKKSYNNIWNGYSLSNLTASEYFDLRNQYMKSSYCDKKNVFDEATYQLQNSMAMIQDAQEELKRIPGVDTSLQQSLQIMNRQLSKISIQNANLIKLYAKAYMEENTSEMVKLKDKKEESAIDDYYARIIQGALEDTAKDVGASENDVQVKSPLEGR
jgi:hypothetical protein